MWKLSAQISYFQNIYQKVGEFENLRIKRSELSQLFRLTLEKFAIMIANIACTRTRRRHYRHSGLKVNHEFCSQ